jgi:hypothetical protein
MELLLNFGGSLPCLYEPEIVCLLFVLRCLNVIDFLEKPELAGAKASFLCSSTKEAT